MGAISDRSAEIFTKYSDGTQIDVAKENRLRGNDEHTLLGLTLAKLGPSVFGNLAERVAAKVESKSNDVPSEETKDETIKNLQKERHVLMEQIGAKETTEFNRIQDEKLKEIEKLKSEVDGEIQKKNSEITGLQGELSGLQETLNSKLAELAQAPEENKASIQAEIKQIKADIKAKEKEIETAQKEAKKLAADYETKINALGKEYNTLSSKMQQVLDLDRQISDIEDGGVSSKTEDLKSFSKAADTYRKAMKNPNDEEGLKKAAKELKDTYEGLGENVTPSITKLYELYSGDIEKILRK